MVILWLSVLSVFLLIIIVILWLKIVLMRKSAQEISQCHSVNKISVQLRNFIKN